MSAAKHVPGPWAICGSSIVTPTVIEDGRAVDGSIEIARVMAWMGPDVIDSTARLIAAAPKMLQALRAVLLFHSGRCWHESAEEWERLTGSTEATTKALCDFLRSVLAEVEGRP